MLGTRAGLRMAGVGPLLPAGAAAVCVPVCVYERRDGAAAGVGGAWAFLHRCCRIGAVFRVSCAKQNALGWGRGRGVGAGADVGVERLNGEHVKGNDGALDVMKGWKAPKHCVASRCICMEEGREKV